MQIGIIGLGKMGFNLALNLKRNGYEVIANDVNADFVSKIGHEGIQTADSISELCQKLTDRKVIWLMVPAGKIVDSVITDLLPFLQKNDIVIDGGNSNYKDSKRRYSQLKELGFDFLDCGTSGGTSGALDGACTMIGGDAAVFEYVAQVFKNISVENGCLYTGESGSGHFTKMVHNGIEYGMMQSIAEGFEVFEHSEYDIDFEKTAKLFNHGSVVRGWLMELTQSAFSKDPKLGSIKGIMHSSGEGKWTLETALDLGVPTPVIAMSIMMRYRSQMQDTFSGKVVAALRNEFGGHAVEKND
ncbi:decarboxylating 6-phosphogluconate dehydrogenase [Flavobacterium franklandianum]|uniref:Decarboxylating 6-phosphogluconate dehydrogenase n=1 Tax=Flavobacterium franklandianum TaxID=2594430 RepID=A0A553CIX5_9FLAO|nr:decarboxylating 6-phosphogluconate dehydrogenase [Flavobacterium franklandianum]TRX20453.1 decarboxylating 6-phosphogluconate dehydrogenase [Flavobacterium franklandianum]TRX24834.1 decarboxylating 6-phosphogluconate dehydrogenase [Flavobacterium franklandianum]